MNQLVHVGFPATAFFSRSYDETLNLVRESRDYLRDRGAADRTDLDPIVGLAWGAEISRLTTRLTNLMAWMLLQRAVHGGEITAVEACDQAPALGSIKVCLEPACIDPARLPSELGELLDRSARLYQRIARLDEMVRRDVAND